MVLHRHVAPGGAQPIKAVLASPGESDKSFPLWKKVLAGSLAGGISSSLCNPTDLVKVRLQADLGRGGVKRYRGLWHAFSSIVRAEGVTGLYRGAPHCLPICLSICLFWLSSCLSA